MIRLVAEVTDILGEGPVWSAAEERLYWFDIKGRLLHWRSPEGDGGGELSLPMRASAAVPRQHGGLLMATEHGLAFCEPASGIVEIQRRITLPEGFRTNDGNMDPQGRFWWSTMDDNGGKRPGAVFCTDSNLATTQMLDDVHIANTLSVTADGGTLFLADSLLQTIFVYATQDLSHRRVFATTEDDIAPDGSALDVQGCLWNAQWGGARLVRYTPDGSVDRIVSLPVSQPTSCAFGGANLETLYVTSARDGLTEAELSRQPLAGSLFAFEPGVPGLALPAFVG